MGLALVVALAVSLLLSFLLYTRIKRQYAANSQPVKMVAAAKPMEPGMLITADYLTQIDWPANSPLEGSIAQPGDAIGRIVLYPIAAKEPVRESMLAAPGATAGLTAKIPDGMRAVAVETNDVSNVSGFLFPGCHVDVLVTFRPEGGRDSMTATVLQNIGVLSTGEKLQPDPSAKPQNVRQVTLLLTPEQAEKLVLAANQGTVQLALRNGSDQAQEERRPLQLKDLQIIAGAAGREAERRRALPRPEVMKWKASMEPRKVSSSSETDSGTEHPVKAKRRNQARLVLESRNHRAAGGCVAELGAARQRGPAAAGAGGPQPDQHRDGAGAGPGERACPGRTFAADSDGGAGQAHRQWQPDGPGVGADLTPGTGDYRQADRRQQPDAVG